MRRRIVRTVNFPLSFFLFFFFAAGMYPAPEDKEQRPTGGGPMSSHPDEDVTPSSIEKSKQKLNQMQNATLKSKKEQNTLMLGGY